MSPAHHRPALLRCPPRAGGAPARILGTLLIAAGAWVACLPASAQMAPRGEHLLSQKAPGGGVTTAHVPWPARPSAGVSAQRGNGLSLRDNGPWPDWEGRIGAVIERPVNPVRDNFVLAQPSEAGLRMRSLHLLADHYVEGGFRATVGLVSGEAGQAWWSGDNQDGGLNLSLQQLDTLGAPMGLRRRKPRPTWAQATARDHPASGKRRAGASTPISACSTPTRTAPTGFAVRSLGTAPLATSCGACACARW